MLHVIIRGLVCFLFYHILLFYRHFCCTTFVSAFITIRIPLLISSFIPQKSEKPYIPPKYRRHYPLFSQDSYIIPNACEVPPTTLKLAESSSLFAITEQDENDVLHPLIIMTFLIFRVCLRSHCNNSLQYLPKHRIHHRMANNVHY